MKDNANRFLDAFSSIESVFKSWNKTDKAHSFSNYVHYYSKNHSMVKQYRDDLLEFSQLRNAIVHDRAGNNEIIAQPHQEVVEEIEMIAQALTHPPLLSSISFNKLVTCQIHDSLVVVMNKMNSTDFYQLPVLDDVMVVGVLNTQMIMEFMMKNLHSNSFDFEGVKVSDVLNTKHKAEYELLYDDSEIIEVIDLFYAYQESGKNLAAVIVLNDRSKKEGPIGILTSRDIPRLLNEQQNN